LCVAEVKFNFTTQKRGEIRQRPIKEAYTQLARAEKATHLRYFVYVIATLYVHTDDVPAAVANAHSKVPLPYDKEFTRNIPDHRSWMKQHHLFLRQLVIKEPVILPPIEAKRDASRAALSVAVIPFPDLKLAKKRFKLEEAQN